MRWNHRALILLLLLTPLAAYAQKAEVGATLGIAVSPDGKGKAGCGEAILCPIPAGTVDSLSLGPGVSWQASFAYRLANFKAGRRLPASEAG